MSKQCRICKAWIQDKEFDLIEEFYRAKLFRGGYLYRFGCDMIEKLFCCSTCLFKHYRSAWEAYATWLFATKGPKAEKMEKSKIGAI